jgi:PAS domain S-box-containing protein
MLEPPKIEKRTGLRQRAEDQLLSKERDLLRAILDTAGALIVLIKVSGRIEQFNRACEQMTGYMQAEVLGKIYWEILIPQEDGEDVRSFFQNLTPDSFPEEHERRWITKSGEIRLIAWHATCLLDSQGEIEFVIATGFDITEIRRNETVLKQRTIQLNERVKELNCLYSITSLSEEAQPGLDQLLQAVVELIAPAWQFPEVACARITLEDREYATANFTQTAWRQTAEIVVDGAVVGTITVCYLHDLQEGEEGPFLLEERKLINEIAERMGYMIQRHWAAARIAEYQEQLRSLASELALTEQRERRRIAQALHDQVGHMLAGIKFKLGELRDSQQDPLVSETLELLEQAIRSSRNLTYELSPPVLHELGLGAALEWLVHQLRANYGIAGEYIDDHEPKPLGEDMRVVLFQAVRELLMNVAKHSQASSARVEAKVENGILIVSVSDDGAGFDPRKLKKQGLSAGGYGLFSIRERLTHMGGQLQIDSAKGRGTRIELRTPLFVPGPGPLAGAENGAATGQPLRMIRILIADDQNLTREGLRLLLEKLPDIQVVGEAADGEAAVEQCHHLAPDVVVMDIAMPRLNGIEATKRIVAENPAIKVIGLSMHADGQFVLEMLRAGAAGYLLKDCAQQDLAQAIRAVDANLTFLSPGIADSVVKDYVQGRTAPPPELPHPAPVLTAREIEVLALMAEGINSKQSAERLGVSVKTIESHRQHIMAKLELHSVAELTKYAIRAGLVDLGQ